MGLTLPLSKSAINNIAVIGPNADQKDNTLGDYNPNAAKSEQAWAAAGGKQQVVTVYGGLKAYGGLNVSMAQGCELALGQVRTD